MSSDGSPSCHSISKMRLNITLFLILFTTSYATCRETVRLTDEFCSNVPTTRVDSHAFQGRWFQIFLTRGLSSDQLNSCATLNYTLSGGELVDVLNCEFDDFLSRARCLLDKFSRKPDGGPGSFIQSSTMASVPFDIVSLLGSKQSGYAAFAAFACGRGDPRTPGYFILSRTPYLQRKILKRLMKRLKCLGFPLPAREEFELTRVKGCKYFFNKEGFDLFDPEDFVNPT